MLTVRKITALSSLYTFRTSFTGELHSFYSQWVSIFIKTLFFNIRFYFLGMWGRRFRNVFLGLTCFAMLVEGNLKEVKSHYQLCGEMSTNSCTCFDITAPHLRPENSTATSKDPHKEEIHIGAFVPFMEDDRYGYHTAMKMAIRLINNRTDVLDNYTLVLDSVNTHSVRTPEIRLFPLLFRFSLLHFCIPKCQNETKLNFVK